MGAVFMAIIYAMIPIGIIVVMVVKYREIRKARLWPTTTGKVVVSTVVAKKKSPGDPGYDMHDTEMTNEPRVEYEFHVGKKKYRGHRIDLGERTSIYELETILDRYPVGTEVTVYYDPADPHTAVLEREFPKYVWAVGIGCVVVAIAFPLVAAAVYFHGVDWLRARLADPGRAPFVMAATGFGSVTLLMALGFMLYVLKALRWPVVRGRIVSSGVEAFQNWTSDEGRWTRRTHHKSSVVYEYDVNGRKYRGDRLTIGVVLSATLPGFAWRTAARYPVGREVDVHYDPKTPGESVLRPFSLLHLILFVAAGAMLWLAWAVATGRM
jgi:Protein of unknown function (DUF3592)